MRILQIAPPWESVPPVAYGGTEAVVHLLCEELVRRGHDVTLCASGDSVTSADLRFCVPRALRSATRILDKEAEALAHASYALEVAADYDVIHNHAGEEVMALAETDGAVPMLTTMHCNIAPERQQFWDEYDGHYNTVSWAQKRTMAQVARPRFVGVAYNAIDVESFPFDADKDDYLLFISRIAVQKAPHLAIEVAKRTGRRLVIAGKVDPVDHPYFASTVAPLIDGDQIIFAGEANGTQKRGLYRKASCVLMPIVWDEPFGLVMAEAAACGTPVIAFDRGAAPEVVRHGRTGFVVGDVDEMVEAVGRVGEIDPAECRRWVSDSFDVPRMADRYLEMYTRIMEGTDKKVPEPAVELDEPLAPERVA